MSEYRYRVRSKFGDAEEFIVWADQLSRVLEVGSIQMDTWCRPEDRVGSLRGDGKVDLWFEGERVGYVIVEEYKHGQYVRLGG